MIVLVCWVLGHKWEFMPGVTHGDDALFECRRCGRYEWRDETPGEQDSA